MTSTKGTIHEQEHNESKLYFFALDIECHLKKNRERKSYPYLSFFGEFSIKLF